jgi:hypothetical protein
MTRRHRFVPRAVIGVLLSVLAIPAGAVRGADRAKPTPEAKALAKAEATVLDAAVADLRKEYAAHVKDPDGSRLRTQCTYFLDHPVQLSPASLLDVLERPLGDDPRAVAYVKWQLLSAAPEKFDAKLLPRVLSAYEKAPVPPPRFGLSTEDRAKLDALLLKAKREEDAVLSAKVDERVRLESEANKPIVAYRDGLYARLPEGFQSLVAGFRDAHERTLAAAGGGAYDDHAERVVKDAQAWAQSGAADPDQCAKLIEIVAALRFVRSEPYYARVAWRTDKLVWSTKTDAVYSAKKLSDLEMVLREAHKIGKAQQAAQRKAKPAN